MTNLIPMAGVGARFLQKGYKEPKPLIKISGEPMVVRAANSLPSSDRWIFICREEHVRDYCIDKVLKEKFINSEVITVNYLTEGQASTCLLAEPYVHGEEPLLIGACDNSMIWDRKAYNSLVSGEEDVDALIWTFRNNVTVKRNPRMYGWVEVDNNNVVRVSCKVPVSDHPVRDHAIVGAFYFKKASYLFNAIKQMMIKNERINNEFYVDNAMNEVIKSGLKVKIFEVDKYICWGTPDDLWVYQYWERYFRRLSDREQLKKAKKYLQS